MERVEKHYESVLAKDGVALAGSQLVEFARKNKLKEATSQKIYRFLRTRARGAGPFARRDRVKRYQGVAAFHPGVYHIDYGEFEKQWQGSNNGCTGFLVAVENLTNRLFVLPTRGKDTKQWLESISKFVEVARQVSVLYSDRDSVTSERFRQHIQEKYGIRWHYLKKGHKSFLAERYVGFVKTRLSASLEAEREKTTNLQRPRRWVHLVEPLVREYNGQLIPGTSYRRQAVSRENFTHFLQQKLGRDYDLVTSGHAAGPFLSQAWNRAVFKFGLGDRVRVSRKADWTDPENRAGFKKVSLSGGFGRRIYTIEGRQLRATRDGKRMVPVYKLAEVTGGGFNFYENELSLVDSSDRPDNDNDDAKREPQT